MELVRKILQTIWDVIESATFALAIFLVAYLFFFQPGVVRGSSSFPTIKDNERFITDKLSYRLQNPQRGDFVVIKSPQNSEIDFIKRIVGLPGETIMLLSCRIYIDGNILNEPYLQPETCTQGESFLKEGQNYQIPTNFYFMLGDNRNHSSDSRDFGPIPASNIVGKAGFRYWPPEGFGAL